MTSDDPVSAAVIGTMAVGTGLSAMSSIRQGQVAGDTAMINARLQGRELAERARSAERQALITTRNAQLAEREAQIADMAAVEERQLTEFELERAREQGQTFLAEQRVQVAGSGLEATGSPLMVMAESGRQLELNQLALQHAGEVRARQAEEAARQARGEAGMQMYDAEELRYQARKLREGVPISLDTGRYQARASRQAGQLGAVRSILSGGANIGATYYGTRG